MITLYYAPDNASLVVRILLEELGLPYKTELVDRSNQAQKSADYLSLNPNGLIPVCVIDGIPVFETAAILLALADKHNQFAIPTDDKRRPEFLKWLFYLSNSLHVDCRMRFYPDQYAGDSSCEFAAITFARLNQRLDILESAYTEAPTDAHKLYFFSNDPTVIDFYLAVCIRWIQIYPMSERGRITLDPYPGLLAMVSALEGRENVIEACGIEGIRGAFFSAPKYADPPEGIAL